MKSETFSKSAKKAEDNSILKAIATTVPLKYGAKFLFRFDMPGSENEPKMSEPSPMIKHQITFEWPRMSNLDPVGLDYLLTIFRRETEVSV